jgi:BirA family biotin operon repressor/biotin-[acetyl-CoA-carboxylase] ligase
MMPSMWTLDETHRPESTQDQIAERILAGTGDPVVPLALFSACQAHGRGSHGRQWVPAPDSVAVTCAWPLSEVIAQQVMAADTPWPVHLTGAMLRAVESSVGPLPELQIKWPNDLWLGQKKLGGLLVERRRLAGHWWWLIGAGLNGRWDSGCPHDFSAIGLFDVLGSRFSGHQAADLARPIATEILGWLNDWQGCEASVNREDFLRQSMAFCQQRDALRGHPVAVRLASGQQVTGIAEGLADNGTFLLQTTAGVQCFRVGEARILRLNQEPA